MPINCILCFVLFFLSVFFQLHLCNCAMNRKAVSGEVADSSIELQVFLPSGRYETVAISQSGTVADLKIAAQQSFGQRFLRLATADGCLLDPTESLRLSGLQNGVSLAAVAQQPKIAATRYAFALWCVGGDRIVTWGHPRHGGDSSRVQRQLTNAAFSRFVALAMLLLRFWQMEAVVTWGDSDCGGDSSRVQHQLTGMFSRYCGTDSAFAAILADGTDGDLGQSRPWW